MNFENLFNYNSEIFYKEYYPTRERERERGVLINNDCIKVMNKLEDEIFNLTITDIPYGEVNRKDNGLRNLNKENADVLTFDLESFLNELYRLTTGTIIIFCGIEQVSPIAKFFSEKQKDKFGTMRHLVWTKTNPSPMNGDYIYLSAIENAVWFKKRGGTFNAHCKKNYFAYPCGKSKQHPTEKNHDLIKELILDNSNENDIIFDPCSGSGTHCLVAKENNRRFVGIELDKIYFNISKERFKKEE